MVRAGQPAPAGATAPDAAGRGEPGTATVRLFVAVDVPPALAAALLATLPRDAAVRPAPVAQVHLTLCFLGACAAPAVAQVEHALAGVTSPAFTLVPRDGGRFRGRQGSVLWIGVADPAPLRALHEAVRFALREAGLSLPRERFLPHLTVARCRPGAPEPLLQAWLAARRGAAWPAVEVGRFLLYASELSPGGARHHVLRAFPLAPSGQLAEPERQPQADQG